MKKFAILGMCLFVLTMGLIAFPDKDKDKDKDKDIVNYGTFTSDADFTTKFWKEMFKGGGPGQPGNALMAVGQGFIFKKAILQETVVTGPGQYDTTYVKGDLMLNSSGPWLNKGSLKDTKIIALNQSTTDGVGGLVFTLTFSGQFDNTGVFYRVTATYSGTPEVKYDDSGIPVFQRDHDFDAVIEISDTAFPGIPDEDDIKKPKVNYGEFSTCNTDGPDFNTKFWKEMFKGGGPGQVGNTLKALGDGFIFKQAKLAYVMPGANPDEYITRYEGGVLILNSSGPWLKFGKLHAFNVTAMNTSTFDNVSGYLEFKIEMEGQFIHPGVHFKLVATYRGNPEIKYSDEMRPIFQRGTDFDIVIVIDDEPITDPLEPCVNGN